MINIERIVLREIRLPLKEPFRISSGVVTDRRIALLELFDADGTIGWSECVAGEQPNYSSETIDTAWLAIREWLARRVIGHAFDHPATCSRCSTRTSVVTTWPKRRSRWACGTSPPDRSTCRFSKLLGGTRDRVATGISIGIQASPDALVQRARAAYELGISQDQGEDPAGRRHRVRARGAGRARPHGASHGGREFRLHARRCRPSRRAR